MGSIGIISLTTRRNRRSSICRNIPVVKVRRAPGARLTTGTTEVVPPPSDPLVRGLPQVGRARIRGSMRDMVPILDGGSGIGPDLFS